MEDALSLFQFVKSNAPKGQFIDVVDFLVGLGYSGFSEQYQFLEDLKREGYITKNDNPLSPMLATHQSVQRNPNDQYKMMVKLTGKAEEYIKDAERIQQERLNVQDSLKLNRWAVRAAWFSGVIAFALLVVAVTQCVVNKDKDNRIASQDSTLNQLQSEVSKLSRQKDSLSSSLKERKSPPKKTSKPKPRKK